MSPLSQIVSVAALLLVTVNGHHTWLDLTPHYTTHQHPYHSFNCYHPFRISNPSYQLPSLPSIRSEIPTFSETYYSPPILPYIQTSPNNETAIKTTTTTEKPTIETIHTSTVAPKKQEIKAPNSDGLKTVAVPVLEFIPNLSETNYPELSAYQPFYNNPTDFYHKLNNAIGVNGFKPFFYDQYMKTVNLNCSSNPFEPCNETKPPSVKTFKPSDENQIKYNFKEILDKIRRPDSTAVFNTKAKDEWVAIDNPDDRNGKAEDEEEPFFKAFKDVMFLNKSYLSTVAPYLH